MTTAAPSSADGATPPTPDHDETMPGVTFPTILRIYDVAHQVALLRDVLQSEKRRIGFFFGAGCPLGIYDEANRASVKHIPDVAGLTEQIAAKLAEDGSLLGQWDSLIRMCDKSNVTVGGGIKINVEHILTEIRTICSLSGVQSVGTLDPKLLRDLDSAICKHIAGIVGKKLPHYKTSYHRFAEWLGRSTATILSKSLLRTMIYCSKNHWNSIVFLFPWVSSVPQSHSSTFMRWNRTPCRRVGRDFGKYTVQ